MNEWIVSRPNRKLNEIFIMSPWNINLNILLEINQLSLTQHAILWRSLAMVFLLVDSLWGFQKELIYYDGPFFLKSKLHLKLNLPFNAFFVTFCSNQPDSSSTELYFLDCKVSNSSSSLAWSLKLIKIQIKNSFIQHKKISL